MPNVCYRISEKNRTNREKRIKKIDNNRGNYLIIASSTEPTNILNFPTLFDLIFYLSLKFSQIEKILNRLDPLGYPFTVMILFYRISLFQLAIYSWGTQLRVTHLEFRPLITIIFIRISFEQIIISYWIYCFRDIKCLILKFVWWNRDPLHI